MYRIFARLLSVLLAVSSIVSYAQNKPVILQNGQYFNGTSFVPFKEMEIAKGRIAAIRDKATHSDGERIDLKSQFVIPGLIDAHVHISGSPTYPYVFADPMGNLKSALRCGVTTVIDLFYPETGCKEVKNECHDSTGVYSSIIMSGPILTAPGGHGTEYGIPTRTMTTVAEARKIVADVIDSGADVIKVAYQAYTNTHTISKEVLFAIIQEAHKRHKKVFVHIDDAAEAMDCAEGGADVLAHMPVDSLTPDQIRAIKKSGMVIIPTFTVYQSAFEGHSKEYMSDSLLWSTANPAYLENYKKDALPKIPLPESVLKKMFPSVDYKPNLMNCVRAGIPILAGTDAGNYAVFCGYSLHNEVHIYVQDGMSNAEALRTATENIHFALPDVKIGKIAAGYDADIVVLGSDPLVDISNTKDIRMVFHKGLEVDRSKPVFEQRATKDIHEKGIAYDPSVFTLDGLSELPPYVSRYCDDAIGGNSTLDLKLQDGGLHISGKVVVKGYLGFAGGSFILSKNKATMTPVDISRYKMVQFDVKGNGEAYKLIVHSDKVKDYNYHMGSFTAPKEWTTVKVLFNDLKQNPYYGKQLSFDPTGITAITFIAQGKSGDADLEVRNIKLVE
jgi:imidazolonepropionase-like amidohydrolase